MLWRFRLHLRQPPHQLVRSRMLFVRFDLAGLFDEGFRLFRIVARLFL